MSFVRKPSSCRMGPSSFPAAEILDSNDDVLTEILLRLPAKILTRFKSVSKYWLSLISSDQFRRLHTRRHTKPQPSLIFLTRTSKFFYFNPILNCGKLIPFTFTIPNPKIKSCCNGLLLLQSGEDYFVYNPTTKQSRNITLTNNDECTNVEGLHLAFDPSKSLHYKIVCVRMSCLVRRRCHIEVYDSESHSWELCLEPLETTLFSLVEFRIGVYWNNAIYWQSLGNGCPHSFFDIDKKIMGSLINPQNPFMGACLPHYGIKVFNYQLQELNGYLYHVLILEREETSLAIFEWQECRSEWMLRYHDRFYLVKIDDVYYNIMILNGGHNGETYTLLTLVPDKIITYRTLDKSSVELNLMDQSFYQEDYLQSGSLVVYKLYESLKFYESLAPV